MLFNLLVLLIILMATAYFATQGLLSAVLALVTGAFASILAMGLFEPLQGIVEGHWPSLARGVTFMSLYVVIFLVLRFGADYAVPTNIKLPKMIDNATGGVVGFFAALMIVGTALLGLEMFPVHTTILGIGGDQEYPSEEGRMQGGEQGQVVPDAGMSMWPQHFALAFWNGVSNRSLGGNKPFGSVHPDLPMESYGYRNVVEYGSNPVVEQELLDDARIKSECYVSSAPDLLKKCNIPDGKQALVVRVRVKKGTNPPAISADVDNLYRITPTEVRVVTDREQRYPIGHLHNETRTEQHIGDSYVFQATPLDRGHLIDDYVHEVVVEEWVFELEKDEKPLLLELKQLARAEFPEKISNKPFTPLASAEYPKRDYRWEAGSVAVTVLGESGPLKQVTLMLVPGVVQIKDIQSAMTRANSHIEDVLNQANDGTEPWASALGKPGIPPKQAFITGHQTVTTSNTETIIRWSQFVPVLMLGTVDADGARNLNAAPMRFKDTVEVLLKDIRVTGVTGADGKVIMKDVTPGEYCLIGAANTESGGFCVWSSLVTVQKKTQTDVNLRPSDASFSLTEVK